MMHLMIIVHLLDETFSSGFNKKISPTKVPECLFGNLLTNTQNMVFSDLRALTFYTDSEISKWAWQQILNKKISNPVFLNS